jgi:N-acetylglucosaminyldiphosphoundecaprenol N-acetyl-beta-D-mannosaminyltransferase
MNPCLIQDLHDARRVRARGPSRASRAMDLCVSGLLLLLLAPLLLLATAIGRPVRRPAWGLHGAVVARLGLELPVHRIGRTLAALGAAHWPLLLNIWRGDLAFVGPRLRDLSEDVSPATLALRPGLVNSWFIRRRTAVDFGTEEQADAELLAGNGLRHDAGLLLRSLLVALVPPRALAAPGRVQLADVAFDNVDMNEALARLSAMLDGTQAQQVSFVNPACVNIAASHRGYRRVLARAALVLPDGIGVKIGSDLLGTPLKQNVNGTDLFPRLCEMLQARGARLFLLGGHPGVAEGVAAEIARRWPALRVVGQRHGYFTVAGEGAVVEQVRASGADFLLVARGVPSQDLFIDRHLPLLGVKVAMGVGGLFDFVSGRISRAPMWMRETGLEWVYRLLQEPGRMWRRYLVGNLTFLARIGLQRVGLRGAQRDVLPAVSPPLAETAGRRLSAVIFATAHAAPDLPAAADLPAALLPVGCQTLVEHTMDQLAAAGVTDVHLVMCDRPESFRACLGDGSRWGLRLHWLLAKDARRPYGPLLNDSLRAAPSLLLGHADACLDAEALRQLQDSGAMAMHTAHTGELAWTGWAAIDPARLPLSLHDLDRRGLARALSASPHPHWPCHARQLTSVPLAEHLLSASLQCGRDDGRLAAPAAWIVQPWGAMSPQARVHPGAVITGPALVGPGCVVERGAVLGDEVVLTRNVVVSAGSRLRQTVVLPNSYVGANLDLTHTVVHGPRVRHLRLGVESVLPDTDALLLDLAPRAPARPTWIGRALAASLLPLVVPLLGAHALQRRSAGRPLAWRREPAVIGRSLEGSDLQLAALRCPRTDAPGRSILPWARMAGLLDIAAGIRCWWGARPRSPGHWYALSPEWQRILADAPVGLLHSPAWTDQATHEAEVMAAADVYWAVQPVAQRLRQFVTQLLR